MTRLLAAAPGWSTSTDVVVVGSGVVATRVGLVDLIATGYGAFAYVMLAIFIIPLLTIGLWRLLRRPQM